MRDGGEGLYFVHLKPAAVLFDFPLPPSEVHHSPPFQLFMPPFLLPSLHSALFRALAYRFLAVAYWKKSDHGTAIGLILQAQALLKPRADGVSSGLPSMDDSRYLSKFKPQVEILRKEVNGMLTSWNQDNNMIYFAAVVDAMSLPPLPAGANMVQLTKYDYMSSSPPILFSEPAEAKTS